MKRIPLSQGKFALVDDADFERLSKFKWYALWSFGDVFYAVTNFRTRNGKTLIYMHRYIMKTPKKLKTDHKNGNGLDNRKSNLRSATNPQNSMNQRLRSDNTSGYKGVSWDKNKGKWIATIEKYNKPEHLGVFTSPIEAAKAYNNAAKIKFGDFAYLNPV